MELWLIWIIAGVIFFIIELFTPTLFFLNLAIGCFFAEAAAYYGLGIIWQVIIWGISSAILLLFVRPLFMKNDASKKDFTEGLDDKYIGHVAKTIKPTSSSDGRIAIYGEEWVARSIDGSEISENTEVKIIKNDGTIFFVEKVK